MKGFLEFLKLNSPLDISWFILINVFFLTLWGAQFILIKLHLMKEVAVIDGRSKS